MKIINWITAAILALFIVLAGYAAYEKKFGDPIAICAIGALFISGMQIILQFLQFHNKDLENKKREAREAEIEKIKIRVSAGKLKKFPKIAVQIPEYFIIFNDSSRAIKLAACSLYDDKKDLFLAGYTIKEVKPDLTITEMSEIYRANVIQGYSNDIFVAFTNPQGGATSFDCLYIETSCKRKFKYPYPFQRDKDGYLVGTEE